MEPTEVERLLLLSIKKPDDIAILKSKYGISVLNFPIYHKEAEFIYNFVEEFERVPLKDELVLEFPTFPYSDGSDNLDYIGNEFNKEVIRREIIRTAATYLKPDGIIENDSRGGLGTLINRLQTIRDKYVFVDSTHRNAIDSEAAMMRLQRYEELISGERVLESFNIGIEPLNGRLRCLPGNLIGLFAGTGVGKSWIAAKIASEFFFQDEKVVVISPELSVEELNYRTDVILAKRMGYNLSYYNLLNGVKDLKMLEDYRKFLAELGERSNWVNYDNIEGGMTLESIEAILVNEKPKLMVIDGIYLMDEKGMSSWELVKVVSNGLKKLATKHNTAIVITNQAGRSAEDSGKAAKREDVADGLYFIRAPDIVMSLGKISDLERSVLELRVLKVRGGADINDTFYISFNPDSGDVGYFAPELFAPPDNINNY